MVIFVGVLHTEYDGKTFEDFMENVLNFWQNVSLNPPQYNG